MAKELLAFIKLQVPAGKANPAPPVGTALGPHGINIQDFCTQFNNQTKEMGDTIVPVEISVYADRSFSFIMKSPPAAVLIKKAKLEEIAEIKKDDLNANDIDAAVKIIAGTARSMGVKVEG